MPPPARPCAAPRWIPDRAAQNRSYLRRSSMPERTVEETVGEGNYVQIEEGLTDAMAHDEPAAACAATCASAAACAWPPAARWALRRCAWPTRRRPAGLLRLHAACGAVHRLRRLHAGLPDGAIRLEDRDGVRRTIITGTVVREQPLLACSECGGADADACAPGLRRHRLPDHMAALLDRRTLPPVRAPTGRSPRSGGKRRPR